MLVTRCVECNHEELSVNSGCLCACHVRVESARTPAERIAELEAQVRNHQEDEGSCCPEDVGFVEYIGVLFRKIAALTAERDAALGALAMAHDALLESRMRIEALLTLGYFMQDPGGENATRNWLAKVRTAIMPMEPTVAAFIERVEARGAARATNELAILRNARKVGEHYLRECIESRQSSDRSGNITNSWAVVVIPDWQFRQMLYGIEPEARAAELEGA